MSSDTSRVPRFAGAVLIVGALVLPFRLSGQVQWTAQVGAAWSSPLVSDAIVSPVDLAPNVAPALLLGASIPSDAKGRRVGLEALLTSGSFVARENGGSTDLGTLRTATVTLAVTGPLVPSLRWRAALGFISYLPADRTGIFQDGAPTRVLGGLGIEYRRAWKPGWTLVGSLRWDFHRFTTPHLQSQGFTGAQDVHRITLTVGIVR